MFQHSKLSRGLDFHPGPFKPGHRDHVEASDDAHEGVEVSNVDTLPGHFNPKLNDFDPELLLLFLTDR